MSVSWTKFSQSELVSIAFANSSSVINGAVTTRIIALVTGIAIAAFVVTIFAFCKAIVNSLLTWSAFSKTEASSGKSIGCIKNLSRTHWFSLLVEIWANLISVLLSSMPKISSPWADFFPSRALKKLSTFPTKLFFPSAEILFVKSFLSKLIFFNLILLNFSKTLKFIFDSETSLFSTEAATFCEAVTGSVCSGSTDGSSFISSIVSWWTCSSFLFSAWMSSNHFSNIGIASSRLGVPDEEIFCFPSK